jgi:hypothetical protein
LLKKAGIGHGISSDLHLDQLNPKVAEKIKHFQFQLYGKTIKQDFVVNTLDLQSTAKNINT